MYELLSLYIFKSPLGVHDTIILYVDAFTRTILLYKQYVLAKVQKCS
jgi:hypothetical protein